MAQLQIQDFYDYKAVLETNGVYLDDDVAYYIYENEDEFFKYDYTANELDSRFKQVEIDNIEDVMEVLVCECMIEDYDISEETQENIDLINQLIEEEKIYEVSGYYLIDTE